MNGRNLFCFKMPMLKRSEWVSLSNVCIRVPHLGDHGVKKKKKKIIYYSAEYDWTAAEVVFSIIFGVKLNKSEKCHKL